MNATKHTLENNGFKLTLENVGERLWKGDVGDPNAGGFEVCVVAYIEAEWTYYIAAGMASPRDTKRTYKTRKGAEKAALAAAYAYAEKMLTYYASDEYEDANGK